MEIAAAKEVEFAKLPRKRLELERLLRGANSTSGYKWGAENVHQTTVKSKETYITKHKLQTLLIAVA